MKLKFITALFISLWYSTFSSGDIILFEDFEDGTVSYTTSNGEFTDGSEDYFTRTDGSNISGQVSFTGGAGSGFFAGQDLDGDGEDPIQVVFFNGIDIDGFTDLSWSTLFAEDDDGTSEDWDASDFVHVDYQIDGGGFQNLFWLENNGSTFNSAPQVDTDFDGTGDGAVITDAFTNFSSAITETGVLLDVRITVALDSGDEDIAFDNFLIEGTPTAVPEPGTLGFLAILGLGFIRRKRS